MDRVDRDRASFAVGLDSSPDGGRKIRRDSGRSTADFDAVVDRGIRLVQANKPLWAFVFLRGRQAQHH